MKHERLINKHPKMLEHYLPARRSKYTGKYLQIAPPVHGATPRRGSWSPSRHENRFHSILRKRTGEDSALNLL